VAQDVVEGLRPEEERIFFSIVTIGLMLGALVYLGDQDAQVRTDG
jgi:hypothetical protein